MSDDRKPADAELNRPAEPHPAAPKPVPRYEKPTLRRYDQIEQVRPYGPSEV